MMRRVCDVCGADCTGTGYEVTIQLLYGDTEIGGMVSEAMPRHVCKDDVAAVRVAVGLKP
jgi:hypothetical protein